MINRRKIQPPCFVQRKKADTRLKKYCIKHFQLTSIVFRLLTLGFPENNQLLQNHIALWFTNKHTHSAQQLQPLKHLIVYNFHITSLSKWQIFKHCVHFCCLWNSSVNLRPIFLYFSSGNYETFLMKHTACFMKILISLHLNYNMAYQFKYL